MSYKYMALVYLTLFIGKSAFAYNFAALEKSGRSYEVFNVGDNSKEFSIGKTKSNMSVNYGQIDITGPEISAGIDFNSDFLNGITAGGDFNDHIIEVSYEMPSSDGDCGELTASFEFPTQFDNIGGSVYAGGSCDYNSVSVFGGGELAFTIPIPVSKMAGIPAGVTVELGVPLTAGLRLGATLGYGGKLRPNATGYAHVKGVRYPDYVAYTVTPSSSIGIEASFGVDIIAFQVAVYGELNIVSGELPLKMEVGGRLYKGQKQFQGYTSFGADAEFASFGGEIGVSVTPAYQSWLTVSFPMYILDDIITLGIRGFEVTYTSPRFSYSYLVSNEHTVAPCNMLLVNCSKQS